MLNVDVFSSISNTLIALFALFVLFLSAFYSGRNIKEARGVWFLALACGFDFVAVCVSNLSNAQYQAGGSISAFVFLELLMLLISMVFLALSASKFLTNDVPDLLIIFGIVGFGLFAIIYFSLISPNNEMVNKIRVIFPMGGFVYVAASFWSRSFSSGTPGYKLSAIITSVAALVLGARLLNLDIEIVYSWYMAAILYVLLAIFLPMIHTDSLNRKIKEKEKEVVKANRRMEDIIKSSPFPIIIARISDDRLLLANTNAVRLFGIRLEELDRYKFRDFFADADNRKALNERLEHEKVVEDFEILVKTPMGTSPFWLLASANIIDYNYDVALYMAFQDITSRKNREVLLKDQATRDPLTALYNRRYFEDEVKKRISASKVAKESFSVLMIDADHFKRVNDTYGHKTGDKVLIELASTCEKALREADIVARYGGEEFVIYLAKTSAEQAKIVADRLRETISEIVVFSEDSQQIKFTVSIGISSSDVSDNIDNLIKTADEALYRAKNNGRNRCEIFTKKDLKTFDMEAQEKVKDEASLRHPVFNKEEGEEISLLDGVAAGNIIDNHVNIEDKNK